MVLQLAGLVTAVVGLVGIARTFKFLHLKELQKAFEGLQRRGIVIVPVTGTVTATGQAVGMMVGKSALPADATVEQRLKFVEEKIGKAGLREELGRQRADLKKSIEDRDRFLKDDIEALRRTVTESLAGSLHVQWLGVACLLFG